MNTISSLILFGVFVMIYGIMMEVFTVLFQLTGITREKAKTQVISLLTNCGFTTSESEIILSSKRRRSLARVTMICGYSFAVIIVSILVNILLTLNQAETRHMFGMVISMGAFLILYFGAMRQQKVRRGFDQLIEKLGNRIMFGKNSNVLILIDIVREKAIVEAVLNHIPQWLDGKKLGESDLKERYHIQILYIRRGEESLSIIDGDTMIQKGDSLLLFGDYKKIKGVFERAD